MRKTICRSLFALLLALSAPAVHAAVSSASSYQDFTANGATTAFSFTFPATSTSWVETLVGGVKQVAGVTVALNANQTTSPGGTVTFSVAPANGAAVRIQRTIPLTQDLVLQPYSAFPARTVERTFDRLAMVAQQHKREIDLKRDASDQAVKDSQQDALIVDTRNMASAGIGDAATVLATGSTTARSLAARAADVVNVKDFGAKGDGVTDDTATIQAAIDRAQNIRAHVFFPTGRYLVSGSGLTMVVGTTLTGPSRIGMGAAQIIYSGTGTALTIAPSNGLAGQAYAFVLRDLGFVAAASGGTAIVLTHASEGLLDHVSIGADGANRWSYGIRMNAAGILQIDSPYVAYCNVGIDANYGTDEFDASAAVTVADGDFWQNTIALRLNNAIGWDIHGNWFEQQDIGVLFDDTATADHIRANNVWVHHNTFTFTGGGFVSQRTMLVLNVGTKSAVVDAMQFESNRIFYAGGGLTATPNPFVFSISSTTGAATDVRAVIGRNHVINGGASPAALVTANDAARVRVEYQGGRYVNGSYVDLSVFAGSGIYSAPSTTAPAASAGAVVNSSQPITLRGTYWTGSATADAEAKIQHEISNNSPLYSELAFTISGTRRASLNTAGTWSTSGGVSPGTTAGAMQGGRIFQGSGAPPDANGSNGDFYLRTDTPGTANQRLYVKGGGVWVGIL